MHTYIHTYRHTYTIDKQIGQWYIADKENI